jgi:hypothetical protein
MHGLVIRSGPLRRILEGGKSWELRGSRTTRRGPIALIESRSGTVVGVCELVDCVGPLSAAELAANADKLGGALGALPYRRTFAWVLRGPRRLAEPVRYAHPPGAVIWVKLSEAVTRRVLAQVGG